MIKLPYKAFAYQLCSDSCTEIYFSDNPTSRAVFFLRATAGMKKIFWAGIMLPTGRNTKKARHMDGPLPLHIT